ncbi:polysaccharide deacetylase family protein [Plesiomonas sp.]|uniref:polysaccharide deacetylase family protein n=1 Tax=Plesiomonas sp. TaxID=2486279 RepID=UPI003F3285DD
MNILMALSQLEVTGAEVYATTVGNELTRRGHAVYYVSDTLTKPVNGHYFSLRFNKRSIPRRFWHVAYLIYLIRKHNIQLVHAHSRASSWSCHIACKLTGTPMVTTVHGRQPVHASRKAFLAMGSHAIAVCEAVATQLINELGMPDRAVSIGRNGIDIERYQRVSAPLHTRPVVTIIGRLTGPKGELCYRLLDEVLDLDKWDIRIYTGSKVPERFTRFASKVNFAGYRDDIEQAIAESNVVIGAGRVAIEALLMGRPTVAIGEANAIGLITQRNIHTAMESNFGDIGPKDLDIDFGQLKTEINAALATQYTDENISHLVAESYNTQHVVDQLEYRYQSEYVYTRKHEIPVIMYHRFITDESEKGVHGTYLHIDMLDKHFRLLKKLGYETLTFSELQEKGTISRFEFGKKYFMITVDDGYKDNLTLLLPLLKKYNFKATVYAVTGEHFNRWDVENPDNPEKKVNLMTPSELSELADSGYIEIGGHTLTHPKLDTLDYTHQQYEISENKQQLEALLDSKLTSFAYPYGIHNEESKDIAKKLSFNFAVATNSGPLALHEDLYQIRRIAIFPRTDTFGFWRKIKGNYNFRKANKAS